MGKCGQLGPSLELSGKIIFSRNVFILLLIYFGLLTIATVVLEAFYIIRKILNIPDLFP